MSNTPDSTPDAEIVIHDTIDIEGRTFPVFWSSTAPGHMQMTDETYTALDAWVDGLAERKDEDDE